MKYLFYSTLIYFFASQSVALATSDTLYIVYTANINGMIQNCNCGKEPLGGMGRVKSYIDKVRSESKHILVMDGGDYFNTYPYLELNQALAKVQQLVKYDVILPGDQAFVEGLSFFTELQQKNGMNWVISNFKNFTQKSKKINFVSFDVEVYGYLSPGSFSFITLPDNQKLLSYDELPATDLAMGEKNLNIMIVHGNEEDAISIRDYYPGIDLILTAHTQNQKARNFSHTPIVGCGKDGEYIALIKAYLDESKWKFEIVFEKMHSGIADDLSVLSIIEEFELSKTD